MTQEEKQLLIKDLSARLPYGVICTLSVKGADVSITENLGLGGLEQFMFGTLDVKPYLRPLSSMTEEECITLSRLKPCNIDAWKYIKTPVPLYVANIKQFDFFHSHHLDWRGLIPKGLALEAPEGLYTEEDKQ